MVQATAKITQAVQPAAQLAALLEDYCSTIHPLVRAAPIHLKDTVCRILSKLLLSLARKEKKNILTAPEKTLSHRARVKAIARFYAPTVLGGAGRNLIPNAAPRTNSLVWPKTNFPGYV